MSRTFLDIHILQTVPPSNLNRDDTGSPKSAMFGGVRRSRVSSQAWKRATRKAFNTLLDTDQIGVRTKQVVALIDEKIKEKAPDLAEESATLAAKTLNAAGIKTSAPSKKPAETDESTVATEETGYLLFLSAGQIDNLADVAVRAHRSEEETPAALKKLGAKDLADRDHSVDIALFGRMVADAADLNVDAAVQVAHAISVHRVENEYDYYTAVDDLKEQAEETGAGMIGTVEFNSATLYRYATIDVNGLERNLGDADAAQRAVEAFLTAFITSMPTGKQNTFANRTLPDVVVVRLRETQPINLVGAFELPVEAGHTTGRIEQATARLVEHTEAVERSYDQHPLSSWVVRVGDRTEKATALGESVTMAELVPAVGAAVADRLTERS